MWQGDVRLISGATDRGNEELEQTHSPTAPARILARAELCTARRTTPAQRQPKGGSDRPPTDRGWPAKTEKRPR